MEFILEVENAIPKELCDRVIKMYEKSLHIERQGRTTGGIKLDTKRCKEIQMSDRGEDADDNHEWSILEEEVAHHLAPVMAKYSEHLENVAFKNKVEGAIDSVINYLICSTGFLIQKYEEGGFYKWHHDDYAMRGRRYFSIIIYLNTLSEEDGGCTEFLCGKKIRPECGKVMIAPATWTYLHRGCSVKNGASKYIITSFVGNDLNSYLKIYRSTITEDEAEYNSDSDFEDDFNNGSF